MSNEIKYTEAEDFGPDIITLVNDEGESFEFELLDRLELDGNEYIALYPIMDEEELLEYDGELIVLRVDNSESEESYIHIDDKKEFDAVANLFMERLADEFDFIYGDEE